MFSYYLHKQVTTMYHYYEHKTDNLTLFEYVLIISSDSLENLKTLNFVKIDNDYYVNLCHKRNIVTIKYNDLLHYDPMVIYEKNGMYHCEITVYKTIENTIVVKNKQDIVELSCNQDYESYLKRNTFTSYIDKNFNLIIDNPDNIIIDVTLQHFHEYFEENTFKINCNSYVIPFKNLVCKRHSLFGICVSNSELEQKHVIIGKVNMTDSIHKIKDNKIIKPSIGHDFLYKIYHTDNSIPNNDDKLCWFFSL